jgi:hypothetical protein
MSLRTSLFLAFALLPAQSLCQTGVDIPAGTPLALTIDRNYRMRVGEPIRARLLYPIYADNQLLLPKDTLVTGTVSRLRSDHKRRMNAALGGDFTPFRIPEVRFEQIVLANGVSVPFDAGPAIDGTPIYRAVAPPAAKGGFLRREIESGLNAVRGDLAFYIAPGRGDRFLQFVYGRLPYHPQRIEKGTSWTIETTAALELPQQPPSALPPDPSPQRKRHFWEQPAPATPPLTNDSGTWIVQANLADSLSSDTSKSGEAIKAVVAEPIYNSDHTVAVPEGATLIGTVTRAKPARRFGRSGVLSFNFSQLVLPDAEAQTVETRLTGADSAQNIVLNSEGQAQSKPQDKIAIPLFLAALAARPLDQDCGHSGGCSGNTPGKSGLGGAAGLGLVGTIVGIAGGSPYVAAGIGYWGAARAVYSRWIARGQTIAFPKDTRIVVQTTPRHSAPMRPNSPQVR